MIGNKIAKFNMANILATTNFILFLTNALIQCNSSNVNNNFQSVPTTVKTFENDTVLLPCYHNCKYDLKISMIHLCS